VEETDKFDFLLDQMAELRASASAEGTLPTQSTQELQQKLSKALTDNAGLRAQVAKCDEDIAAVRAQLAAQDHAKAMRLATIERQLTEAVEARDSGVQMIKQKCDEIEKLKNILHSTVVSPGEQITSKKDETKDEGEKVEESEERKEEREKVDDDESEKEFTEEKDFAKELERTENELQEISEKYLVLTFYILYHFSFPDFLLFFVSFFVL
jgi:uncharacterized protein (DUF305 family)